MVQWSNQPVIKQYITKFHLYLQYQCHFIVCGKDYTLKVHSQPIEYKWIGSSQSGTDTYHQMRNWKNRWAGSTNQSYSLDAGFRVDSNVQSNHLNYGEFLSTVVETDVDS
ncbi:hypothetical protein ABKN59_006845 [Abortiporus biennis]